VTVGNTGTAVTLITMTNDCDVSRIITTFFLNTCRLPPLLLVRNVQATLVSASIATKRPAYDETDEEAKWITLISGSVAEFYIEPMLPLVGDVDVMSHLNTQLAIPRGHPPTTQLPADFHNYVQVVRYMRLLTVTYLAMCTYSYVTY